MDILPISIEDLVTARTVESIRIDYKSCWSEATESSVIRTISAFANDLLNLNGGYIIVGIEAPEGIPKMPPAGIHASDLERVQKEIRGACKRIIPEYQPLLSPVKLEGENLIAIWAPAGDNRPYAAPDRGNARERTYFVRHGAETVKATGEILRQLVEQTAHTPFDDRRSLDATVLDLSPILVKRFLQEVRSDILHSDPPVTDTDLYRVLRVVTTVGETLVPRNVGLLFFNERPDRFFPGAAVDVVQFGDDAGGNLIEERRFTGPLDTIVGAVLSYLDELTNVQLRKVPYQARVERTVAYPYEALEESVVNAFYHRSYEASKEPCKVYLYPDRLEIISYPGPVAGISLEHLEAEGIVPPVPARNRRIGELLKELGLAEMRGTGIPKIRRTMNENGSPGPLFDFDAERTYFRVVLPAHPRYTLVHTLRESAYLWSIGERKRATQTLGSAFGKYPGCGALAGQLIEYLFDSGDRSGAEAVIHRFHTQALKSEPEMPYIRFFKILFNNGEKQRAREVIDMLPETDYLNDPIEVAIAYKRLKVFDKAHTLLSHVYSRHEQDPVYLHNYAQTKLSIAGSLARRRNPPWQTIKRLQREALELLRRAIPLTDDKTELAWCWFDLARTAAFVRLPPSEVDGAYQKARGLLPGEPIFREAYEKWNARGERRAK